MPEDLVDPVAPKPSDARPIELESPEEVATQTISGWFLVLTKPRMEQLALVNLERQGYQCYLPFIKIEKIRRRKREMVTEPMFPRYLFIRLEIGLEGTSWMPIRSTTGVTQIVRFGMQPARVDDRLIELLQMRERQQQQVKLFEDGDRVRISEGAFAGIEAIYQQSDGEQRSMILITLLNQQRTISIDSTLLRKAD